MSIGFCLWQTGAAEWLAIQWLVLFRNAPWFVFVMGTAFFVLASIPIGGIRLEIPRHAAHISRGSCKTDLAAFGTDDVYSHLVSYYQP